jgi:hypothetical protein
MQAPSLDRDRLLSEFQGMRVQLVTAFARLVQAVCPMRSVAWDGDKLALVDRLGGFKVQSLVHEEDGK